MLTGMTPEEDLRAEDMCHSLLEAIRREQDYAEISVGSLASAIAGVVGVLRVADHDLRAALDVYLCAVLTDDNEDG